MSWDYLGIEQDMVMDGRTAVRQSAVGAYDSPEPTLDGIWATITSLFSGKGLNIAPSGDGIITKPSPSVPPKSDTEPPDGSYDWFKASAALDAAKKRASLPTKSGSSSIKGSMVMSTPRTQNKAPSWVSQLQDDSTPMDWSAYDRDAAAAFGQSDIPSGYTMDPDTGELRRTAVSPRSVPSGSPVRVTNQSGVQASQSGSLTGKQVGGIVLGTLIVGGALFMGYRALKSNGE